MKTRSRTNFYLPLAAMILTAALADSASAQTSCLNSGRPDASRVSSTDKTPTPCSRRGPPP
jgi:hypothetical protein